MLGEIINNGTPAEKLILVMLPAIALFVLMAALLAGDGSKKKYKRRLDRLRKDGKPQIAIQAGLSARRSTTDSDIASFDRLIKAVVPRPEALRLRLSRAGLKPKLGNYVIVSFVLFVLVAGGGIFLDFQYLPPVGAFFVGLFIGIGLPHLSVSFLIGRRKRRFIQNFPEAIDLMTRGLKSGLPISESIKSASEEIPDPVGCELKEVTDQVLVGKTMDEALNECAKRLDLQEFNFFTVALAIQAETGGNLTETLGNLSDVLRKRRTLKLKIKALSSEAKASAYIIGSLPFVMSAMIHLTNPNYLLPLINDPRGHFLVGLGFMSFAVGIGVMYRMVKFEV
jgi:tight adherence protein B